VRDNWKNIFLNLYHDQQKQTSLVDSILFDSLLDRKGQRCKNFIEKQA
jgi:hypothetical protein